MKKPQFFIIALIIFNTCINNIDNESKSNFQIQPGIYFPDSASSLFFCIVDGDTTEVGILSGWKQINDSLVTEVRNENLPPEHINDQHVLSDTFKIVIKGDSLFNVFVDQPLVYIGRIKNVSAQSFTLYDR